MILFFMFKIKSEVEITRESESNIRKKNYNPSAGYYACPFCKNNIEVYDFYDIESQELQNEDVIKLNNIKINKYEAYDGISFIQKFEKECIHCKFPIEAEIVFFVQYQLTDSTWNYSAEICFSRSLEYRFESFLSLGTDIYTILPQLILRWWRKNYHIDFVMPFINVEYLDLFIETAKYFSCYRSRFSYKKIDLESNPFRYIVFREIQNRYKGKKTTINDIINTYYDDKISENGEDFFILNQDYLSKIKKSIYLVNNVVDTNDTSSLVQKYSNHFHAKFMCGSNDNNAELYLMSYNLGDVEALQFETQCFIEVDSNKYNDDISIFMNYHRLKLNPLNKL